VKRIVTVTHATTFQPLIDRTILRTHTMSAEDKAKETAVKAERSLMQTAQAWGGEFRVLRTDSSITY